MAFGSLHHFCIFRFSRFGIPVRTRYYSVSLFGGTQQTAPPLRSSSRAAQRYSSNSSTPGGGDSEANHLRDHMPVPVVAGEELVYKRYLSVFNRRIHFPPNGSNPAQEFEFDVVGHPKSAFHFVCVFPVSFVDGKPRVTLLKEYCWGPDAILYSLPTGGFDPTKHASFADAARAELSEEARLCGGELVQLLPDSHPGISETKWSVNRFTPFLVINPQEDSRPGEREGEEFIEITTEGWEAVLEHLYSGYFNQPGFTTSMLAIKYLTDKQLLPGKSGAGYGTREE